jgi:hypothetical protein
MAQTYVVKQGDYLTKIAQQFGFADYVGIWEHPDNKALRNERKSPNVLMPGDRLFIPDPQQRFENRPSGQRHRFVLKRKQLKLCLQLLNMSSEPLKNVACELTVEGRSEALKTDGQGKLETVIPRTAQRGTLKIDDPDLPLLELDFDLAVGHVDPVTALSGQQARLNNLGYGAGPRADLSDAENEKLFRSAVEEFQCDHQMKVDGQCGPATQAKLKEVYGC